MARHVKYPDMLIVEAATFIPGVLSTGIDSPVREDSFTALVPVSMIPSTGMLMPGFSTKISPTFTFSTGTSCSRPSTRRTAVLGDISERSLRAPDDLPFTSSSRNLPTRTRVRMIAAVAK